MIRQKKRGKKKGPRKEDRTTTPFNWLEENGIELVRTVEEGKGTGPRDQKTLGIANTRREGIRREKKGGCKRLKSNQAGQKLPSSFPFRRGKPGTDSDQVSVRE